MPKSFKPIESLGRTLRALAGEPLLCLLLIFPLVLALFYLEENWRGKRAWQKCQRELQAKGAELDWKTFLPADVPSDQNVFGIPEIAAWFVNKGPNALTANLNSQSLFSSNAFAEVIVIGTAGRSPRGEIPGPKAAPPVGLALPVEAPSDADLVLRYTPPHVSLADTARREGRQSNPGDTNHLLTNLFTTEIQVDFAARQALLKIIEKYANSTGPGDFAKAKAVQNFTLVAGPSALQTPARVVLLSDQALDQMEVKQLFAGKLRARSGTSFRNIQVASVRSNIFRIYTAAPDFIRAVDYLQWSGQFDPEFELMREALKRPYARMPGDYRNPFSIPIPNFVGIRMIGQILAQRAQCYLLLNEPQKASSELRLLAELGRMLDSEPSRKPISLVAAMIHVALAGLYVNTLADGLRLDAWQESQLRDLGAQLLEINLLRSTREALIEERAAVCHVLESPDPGQFLAPFWQRGAGMTVWDKLQDPGFLFLTFGPRGWMYQNMATVARLEEQFIEGSDPARLLVKPGELVRANQSFQKTFQRSSPENFLAAMTAPNLAKAWLSTAHHQSLVHEAQVACLLQRFRLIHHRFPESLSELVPAVADTLPHDIINGAPLRYRKNQDGSFLLYSVGWNEKDEGGTIAGDPNSNSDLEHGDWVWRAATE